MLFVLVAKRFCFGLQVIRVCESHLEYSGSRYVTGRYTGGCHGATTSAGKRGKVQSGYIHTLVAATIEVELQRYEEERASGKVAEVLGHWGYNC